MMELIDRIVANENLFIKDLEECKQSGFKTYIYGAGEGALNAEIRAKSANIKFAGKLVDRKYYKQVSGVECLEEILASTQEKVNLIVAFKGYEKGSLNEYKAKINKLVVRDCYAGNCAVDPSLFTYEYLIENLAKLNAVYSALNDEKSRAVLAAYINQKISMDYRYLTAEKTSSQYFEKGLIALIEHEVFVDCGAYDGDSARDFINALEGKLYDKIISFEPDPDNFEKLKARGYDRHICLNKGTSDVCGQVRFSMKNTSSSSDGDGEIAVEMVRIDDIIEDRVTYLKMDIEGAELASLKGAREIILRDKPKMAICIYHKKEDLWEVYEYIKSLVPEYKFYMRAYEDTATELVLYAL